MSHKPTIGEANLSALIAGVIGAIGGLFALGLAPAIVEGKPEYLAQAPILSVISFFLCGCLGWFIGGQLGPRLHRFFGVQPGYIVGGIIGGLFPVLGITGLGWYLVTH